MHAGKPALSARPDPARVREWLSEVTDPEIPVLTIEDLGMLRDVRWEDDLLVVTVTPTYSGCPAMLTIRMHIVDVLRRHGIGPVRVEEQLAPAWTTDWMSDTGKRKLREYGIAPPEGSAEGRQALFAEPARAPCPRCGSSNTTQISEFGSTACKAQYRCDDCLEPFDYFKCI